MNSNRKIFYITELALPSNKAQSVHIFKMIDNSLKIYDEAKIFCKYMPANLDKNFFTKYFNLKSKKKIKIISIFNKLPNNNFFIRLVFGFKVAIKLKNNKNLIISRSIIASFFLILMGVKHFVEIHQEIRGLSKFLFIKLNFINSKYLIKVIFITKNLSKFYNLNKDKFMILNDGCDLQDFKKKKKLNKVIKNIYYFGSFYKGRGIELIEKIAKLTPNYDFHIFGLRDEKFKSRKNFKLYKLLSYREMLKKIYKADILIMPYQKSVSINSTDFNTDIAKFISPIKMFEYLATGIPIISSDLKVLREILVDNKNCFLVKNFSNPFSWKKKLFEISNNSQLKNYVSNNAVITASKNTWELRIKKISSIHRKLNND